MQNRGPNKSSRNSRNPHNVEIPSDFGEKIKSSCNSAEEQTFRQWKAAEGAPISEHATRGMFDIRISNNNSDPVSNASISDSCFTFSDLRLWGPREYQPTFNNTKMRLEFFFDCDGKNTKSKDLIKDRVQKDKFECELLRKLEENLGVVLQEKTQERFLSKVSHSKKSSGPLTELQAFTGLESNPIIMVSDSYSAAAESDEAIPGPFNTSSAQYTESQNNIQVNLEFDSFREGGCMIDFIVCRCTLSTQYSQLLGQQVFPDFFTGALSKWRYETQLATPLWLKLSWVGLFLFIGFVCLCWKRGFEDAVTQSSSQSSSSITQNNSAEILDSMSLPDPNFAGATETEIAELASIGGVG